MQSTPKVLLETMASDPEIFSIQVFRLTRSKSAKQKDVRGTSLVFTKDKFPGVPVEISRDLNTKPCALID